MKLDILAFAAHPDDAELGCGGTILKHIGMGMNAGIVDLTKGELGTRGTPLLRAEEAAAAAAILGIAARKNLGFSDGFFQNDKEHRIEVIKAIREFRPEVVLAPALSDRHPDHGRAASLVSEACFLSGLSKINTGQEAWRPKAVYHYIQDRFVQPCFVVDITPFMDKKMEAVKAFRSQFHDPASKEPQTYISRPEFLEYIRSRAMEYGKITGVLYAEGFTTERPPGIENLLALK